MKTVTLILLAALAFFRSAPFAKAAAGDLDPSFAGTGKLQIGFGRTDDDGRAVALQPDGKIVMAGTSSDRLVIVRFDTNNLPDPTFGSEGLAYPNLPADPEITGLAVQADGKILMAGWIHNAANDTLDFLLTRLNPDGTLDTSFDDDGIAFYNYGGREQCRALMLQSDGKIVVAGTSQTDSPQSITTMVIARFLADGSPDTSFDGDGAITETNSSWAYSLAQQSDGKLLVGASVGTMWGLLRLNLNGTLDTTFGTNGKAHIQSPVAHIAIQPADLILTRPEKIVVAGAFSWGGQQGVKVARVSMNGTLDTTFNSTGSVFKAVGGQMAVTGLSGGFANRFQRQILVTGWYQSGPTNELMLVRFTDSGAVDNAFGTGGVIIQSLTEGWDMAYDMVIQPGLKVLMAGTSRITPIDHDFALARFNWSNGSLDTNFNGTGILLQNIDMSNRPGNAHGVALQADNKIVVVGSCQLQDYHDAVALCRLNPDGTLDDTFGERGRVVTSISDDSGERSEAIATAIRPDGKIVVAGNIHNDDWSFRTAIILARYLPNGALDTSFGSNGIAITFAGTNGSHAVAVALQPDGRIVVGGRVHDSEDTDFLVMRYHPDGSLDSSWNGTGKVITGVGPDEDELNAIMIQADGKIIAAGGSSFITTGKFTAVRYHSNGLLDASFGSFGRVATQVGSSFYDIAHGALLEPNGRIILGGLTAGPPPHNVDVAFVRYHPSGAIESTFDGDGMVSTPIGLAWDYASRLARQSDGKIVAACRTQMGTHYKFGAVRLLANGAVDSGYGFGGVNFYDFGTGGEETLNDMALDDHNRMVMVGEVGGLFGILRVQSDPILRLNSITRLSNGHVLVTGEGVPGATHTLQKSATLANNSFSYLAPVTAAPSGQWQYQDPNPSAPNTAFYRLSYP